MTRYTFVTAQDVKRYQHRLEKFERIFDYQLGPHRLKVSHGSNYDSFFRNMGPSIFLIAQEKEEIIGSLAIVKKKILFKNRSFSALYIADLKIHPTYQLTSLSNNMYNHVANFIGLNPSFCRQSIIYFVAFETPTGGDFTTVKPPQSPLHLFSPLAAITFFMVRPYLLINIPLITDTNIQDVLLNLSPPKTDAPFIDLQGIRDFVQHEKPLKIAHIITSHGGYFIKDLLESARQAHNAGYDWCCFTLDARRTNLIDHLAQYNVITSITAHVYGFVRSAPLKHMSYVCLDTHEL